MFVRQKTKLLFMLNLFVVCSNKKPQNEYITLLQNYTDILKNKDFGISKNHWRAILKEVYFQNDNVMINIEERFLKSCNETDVPLVVRFLELLQDKFTVFMLGNHFDYIRTKFFNQLKKTTYSSLEYIEALKIFNLENKYNNAVLKNLDRQIIREVIKKKVDATNGKKILNKEKQCSGDDNLDKVEKFFEFNIEIKNVYETYKNFLRKLLKNSKIHDVVKLDCFCAYKNRIILQKALDFCKKFVTNEQSMLVSIFEILNYVLDDIYFSKQCNISEVDKIYSYEKNHADSVSLYNTILEKYGNFGLNGSYFIELMKPFYMEG